MGTEMPGAGIVGCLGTGVRGAGSVPGVPGVPERDVCRGRVPSGVPHKWKVPTRVPRERGVPCVLRLCGPGLTPELYLCHRGRTTGRMDHCGSAVFLLTGSPHAAPAGIPGARGPTGSRPRAPECRGWFIRGRAFLIWFGWIYFWEPVAW